MKLNKVNVDKIYLAEKEIYGDLSLANKNITVDGEWILNDRERGQFEAALDFLDGSALAKTDNPAYLGGNENYPEPMQYFLFGIASSFASSYALNASIRGIALNSLSVKIDAKLNYSYFFSVSDDPKIEEITVTLTVAGNASDEELTKLNETALGCCPALSVLKNSVQIKSKLVIKKNSEAISSENILTLN